MKRSALFAAALLLSSCAAGSLLRYRIAPYAPEDRTQALHLDGLSDEVKIFYDAYGVPHIEAKNELDLMRADGYAQGRARFFEMDLMRRVARGRVSELVGEQPFLSGTSTEFDLQMRGWELETRAAGDLEKLPKEERALLDAFVDGVNAALAMYPPMEYRLLGTDPTPWTAADTLVVGLLNAWSVSHNWHQESVRLVLALNLGLERANAIYPHEPVKGGRTLPGAGSPAELLPAIAPELGELFPKAPLAPVAPLSDARPFSRLAADMEQFAGASNGWTLSGARTTSGKPMLANDPHLSHLLPSIVFQHHLKAPGLDVIGITVPGVPYVLAGHNDRVAWGMTSTVADVIDLVVEKLDPANPNQVLHEGASCPLTSKQVEIRARDGSSFVGKTYTLRSTCNGPVLNDLYPDLFPKTAPIVSIRWLVSGVEKSIGLLSKADRAKSVQELQDTLGMLPSPVNTWQAADVDGHIGVFLSGAIPMRTAARGTFPVPGWLKQYEWSGTRDTHAMPHAIDPEAGFLVHANNLIQEPRDSGGHPVNVDSAPAYRYDRIAELINAKPKHDAASLAAMQADVKLLRGVHLAPRMLEDLNAAKDLTPVEVAALKQLAAWDYQANVASSGAAVFFATYRMVITDALADELSPAALQFFLAERYSTNVSDGWFDDAQHVVWDDRKTPAKEGRADIVRRAFREGVAQLTESQGNDPAAWRWGAMHKLKPKHAFGGKSILDGTVNLEEMEAAGGLDSVWKSHFDLGNAKEPFRAMAGPVFRMVADTADLAHAQWIIDTGSSGWPKSAHYGDQYAKWKKGELIPMVSSWDEIRRDAAGVETLTGK